MSTRSTLQIPKRIAEGDRALALASCVSITAICILVLWATTLQAQSRQQHPQIRNSFSPLLTDGDAPISEGTYRNPSTPICTTATSSAANVNTDCEGIMPSNETTIAANPTNNMNWIGSANDVQLFLNPSGFTVETVLSRAHVTFDGGQTWSMYPVPFQGYTATFDPAVAFDATGRAYLSSLAQVFSQNLSGRGATTASDILVAHSIDGGKTWATVRADQATGSVPSCGECGLPGEAWLRVRRAYRCRKQ